MLLHDSSLLSVCQWPVCFGGAAVTGPASLQGPRMVRDVFRLAKENAPAIIFIDEVDAIATARFDAQTGADRWAAPVHELVAVLHWWLPT